MLRWPSLQPANPGSPTRPGIAQTPSSLLPSAAQRKGQTVLVTAAVGGTGQLAVQLALLAGCHVVGTCSGGAKAELLR